MSSQSPHLLLSAIPATSLGEINRTARFSEQISQLCCSPGRVFLSFCF